MTATTTIIQTGSCSCGTTVEREVPTAFAGLFARTPFVCDLCIARLEAEEARDEKAFRRDRDIRHRDRRLSESGLPARFHAAELDQEPAGPQARAIAEAWHWVNGDILGLLLTGPVGVGKTHVAAAALRMRLEHRDGRWVSAPHLFALLGSNLGSDERAKAVSVLIGEQALVIDDIDKSRPTEYGAENIFAAVDGRITNNVPLIVTTNLSLGELAKKWPPPHGEAIASRLAGYCRKVAMDGPDRRTA